MDRVSLLVRRHGPALLLALSSLALLGIDCGGKVCTYDGKTWNEGQSFASIDGCNTCSCTTNGVACTEKACVLKWYRTCGDPVCRGHEVDPNIPACSTQKAGDGCTRQGDQCDPVDPCNVRLVCTGSDPTQQPGGCPK
jgi:hypothetical protein